MAVTKHFKLTAGLRGCSGEVGGCSGSGPIAPGGCALAVQRECRVTFIHAVCARSWGTEEGGGGGTWDFQQTGLISCAGSCPGQGLGTSVLDHEQRPLQAGVVTIPSLFICRFCRNKLLEKLDVLIFSL